MIDLAHVDFRNILFWTGVGGLSVPLLCHGLRQLMPRHESSTSNPPGADQLQGIEGIGPKIAGLLFDAGLTGFADIAASTPSRLRAIMDEAGPAYSLADPTTWPEQARLLANGDIEGFLKLAITLTAGVTTLENIGGIGEAAGERLRLGGINTVAKLAQSSVGQVQKALGEVQESTEVSAISRWIAQANEFAAGDSRALGELAGNLQRATLPAAAAAVLAGPAGTPPVPNGGSSPVGIGKDVSARPWRWRNAAPVCTATLGSLLLLVSFLIPQTKSIEHELRFERECTLNDRTTFPASAFFLKGSTDLTLPEGAEVIKAFVDDLKKVAAIRKDRPDRIFTFGYASEEGSPEYNQRLSERRAQAIRSRLVTEAGWPSELFRWAGKGESEAQACYMKPEAQREDCRRRDRKIEILVVYGGVNAASAQRTCGAWVRAEPLE